jgi:hypothetical protein
MNYYKIGVHLCRPIRPILCVQLRIRLNKLMAQHIIYTANRLQAAQWWYGPRLAHEPDNIFWVATRVQLWKLSCKPCAIGNISIANHVQLTRQHELQGTSVVEKSIEILVMTSNLLHMMCISELVHIYRLSLSWHQIRNLNRIDMVNFVLMNRSIDF